jgi:hypothetical protein
MPSVGGILLISTCSSGLLNQPIIMMTRRNKMHVALYARVSSTRQAQTQTIDQPLTRLRAHVHEHGWSLEERHVYRDDGYSGASLTRPG